MKSRPKVAIILPAYNAEKTLAKTVLDIPKDINCHLILTDDGSIDSTVQKAKDLGIKYILEHKENRGYGANQKTCYKKALELESDYIIMLHPDYQYSPKLIPAMVAMLQSGHYDVVLASRILGNGALKGGMPVYKYIANRGLTFFQNLLIGIKLSEYHTGYRGFRRETLESIAFEQNSDDFIFDNQLIAQIASKGLTIGEISCPTNYFEEASSINFTRSVKYGLGCLRVALIYFLWRIKILSSLKI